MPKFNITTPSGQTVQVEGATQFDAMNSLLGQSGPDVSQLGSFGRGAAGMIPLGDQAYAGIASLAEHKPYNQERQEIAQEVQADKDTNPGARLAGQVAGVAAPIALTAGVAAPETLLGAAGQGALFGGASGAGKAIDTLASGGSGADAASDVALGAGTGALGGVAGQAAGNLLSKATSSLVPSADELSANATAGILGGTPRQIRSLPGKNPVETLNHMGDVIRGAKVGDAPVFSMGDRLPDRLEKFIALQQQAGKTIGDTIENAGVEPVSAQPIIDSLSTSMKFPTPDEKAHLESVIEKVKTYADENGQLPFQRLQQLKTDIGADAFHGQGNPVLQNAYHVINDIQDSELDKASSIINKPEFDQAKKQYQVMSRAVPMLKMGVARELGNKAAVTVPLAATATGHPLIGAAALMKPRLEQIAKNAVFGATGSVPKEVGNAVSRIPSMAGAASAAQQIPEVKAQTDLHLEHPAMAPWRQAFTKNAAQAKDPGEVAKANAVTDFTLSQRDPAYAKAKQTAAESPASPATPKQEPTKMAEGGIVAPIGDEPNLKPSLMNRIMDYKGSPAFGSTLPGLEKMAHKAEGDVEAPDTTLARSSVPEAPIETPWQEQLKAYIMKNKGNDGAN